MKTLLDLIVEFVYPIVIGFLILSFLNGVNFSTDVKTEKRVSSPHEVAAPSAAPRE
jgi:hypothetical protein